MVRFFPFEFKNLMITVILFSTIYPAGAIAEDGSLSAMNEAARQAYEQGKFKRAQLTWLKLIQAAENDGRKDSFLEMCLRQLGQAYRKLEHNTEAYQAFSKANDICVALGAQDAALVAELATLSTIYKTIDPSVLGDETAKALKKANVSSISLARAPGMNLLQVDLPERFEKQLDDKTVDALSFDKRITLELDQSNDGAVLLKNIKGFKIHAKKENLWANLMQAVIESPNEQGAHPAQVTAGKMGVTKTVTALLPQKGFEPLAGLLKELHGMSDSAGDSSCNSNFSTNAKLATQSNLIDSNFSLRTSLKGKRGQLCEVVAWFN